MSDEYDKIAKHFASDSAVSLKFLHEDGIYRHIQFASNWTRVVIVTWPYNLLVAGSHGSFHFERCGQDTEDMLVWLRGQTGRRFQPERWASKLINDASSVAKYDRDKLVAQVNERVEEAIRDDWAPEGLRDAVDEEVLGSPWLDDKQSAFRVLHEFEHGKTYRTDCSCGASQGHDDYDSAVHWKWGTHEQGEDHKVHIQETGGFDFDDLSEWDVDSLDYHYVWSCHAAVWAISRYDKLTRYGLAGLAAPKAVS
jgi:hypothetical protein